MIYATVLATAWLRVYPCIVWPRSWAHDSLDTTLLYIQGTPQDLQQAVETIEDAAVTRNEVTRVLHAESSFDQ